MAALRAAGAASRAPSAFVTKSGRADPASGHVHECERVQEWPRASPTAVSHQIDFDKAWDRLGPVGEGLDRHLVLEQRAWPSRADATLGQPSSRGGKRAI